MLARVRGPFDDEPKGLGRGLGVDDRDVTGFELARGLQRRRIRGRELLADVDTDDALGTRVERFTVGRLELAGVGCGGAGHGCVGRSQALVEFLVGQLGARLP